MADSIRIFKGGLTVDTLIQRTLAGDVSAFNQIVVMYQALAYNVAWTLLRSEDDAADAVQDSFIKVLRALLFIWDFTR